MTDNQIEVYTRDTWSSLLIRLLKIASVVMVSLTLIVGSFLLFDSKIWRYYQYQNKDGFYFEKFNSDQDAELFLKQRYLGKSNTDDLSKVINEIGGWAPEGGISGSPDTYWYYSNKDSLFFERAWRINVWYDKNKIITKIEVSSYLNHI